MSALQKITNSLSQFSRALASTHLTVSHCKECGRETRWMVNIARGRFRCLECDASRQQAPSEQGRPSAQEQTSVQEQTSSRGKALKSA